MPFTTTKPVGQFTDINGKPLDGQVFFGQPNLDPIANPITVYWDAAGTQPVTQPVVTVGGYPMNGSTRSNVFVNADYSILVRNRNGFTVFSAPNLPFEDSSDNQYFLQAGSGAVQRTVQSKLRDVVSVKDFGAVGDGVADDTAAIQAAFNYIKTRGGTLYFSRGTYLVSAGFGTNPNNPLDLADNVTIQGDSATILVNFSALSSSIRVITLEGNNVAVRGLTINSTRTFDLYNTDPAVYRTIQIIGIEIGGKAASYNAITDNLSYYKTGAIVENCSFNNINAPIIITQTSHGLIANNDLYSWTQTGIVVWGCPSDIVVENNRAVLGADDCIFLYNPKASQSAWTTAGNYAGGHRVVNNLLGYTRAKFVGTGGYSDVLIADNICDLSHTQGIAIEADPTIYANGALYNKNIAVERNTINRAGRFYNTTSGYVYWQGPVSTEDVGISTLRAPATTGTKPYGVYVRGNKIVNPNGTGLYIGYVDSFSAVDNEVVAGENEQGSGLVDTNGYGIYTTNVTNTLISTNNIYGFGASWLYAYAIVNLGLSAGDIHIKNNNVPGGDTFAPLGGSGVSPFTSTLLDYAANVPYYAEGTWTPVVTSSGSNPTVSYTTQTGYYTRIGRMVFCQIVLNFDITVGGTGAVVVSLPFVHNGDNQTTNFAHQKVGVSTGVETYDNVGPMFAAATAMLFTTSTGTASSAAVTGSRSFVAHLSYAVY